jgi:sugar diacid utilization regulator
VVRAAAEAVLHAVDDAVATLAEGYADARRELIRREEGLRRQLVDDLLRGDAHLGELAERAEPFGLNLAAPHQVALATPARALPDVEAATSSLERRVFDWFGDRDVLVATKDGMLVVLAPAEQPLAGMPRLEPAAAHPIGVRLHAELSRQRYGGPWRVSVGRPYPGAYGIARSYEEAREALLMATRLGVEEPVTGPQDLLIYRVLLRDQPAMMDLVTTVLGPLLAARGGARPLLDTLDAYFSSGAVATDTAGRLHLSVRAVTYRLNRVRELSGYDPSTPAHRFILQAAVLGAKMLRWPAEAASIAPDSSPTN